MVGVIIFTLVVCLLQAVLYSSVKKEIGVTIGVVSDVQKYSLVLLFSIYIPSVILIIMCVVCI